MFEYINEKKQIMIERRKSEQLRAKQASIEAATALTFVLLAEAGSIDDVTATEHSELFAAWGSDIAYAVGALRRHDGKLYQCVQAHTSQGDWTPDTAASLWRKVGDPSEEYPAWSQPIGAHDAYAMGDKVSHGGGKWTSLIDGNVWEPSVCGWEAVTA